MKRIRDHVYQHLRTVDAKVCSLKMELVAYKECRRVQMNHLQFLQAIRHFVSELGTLYTQIKSYQAAFYAYKINLFSTISSLAGDQVTLHFFVPKAIADILKDFCNAEVHRGTKLSPAIQPVYEAVYYEKKSYWESHSSLEVFQFCSDFL